MVNYINRHIEKELLSLLSYFPAVGLVGARQVGKTTLIRNLETPDLVYVDLEDDRDRLRLADPHLFFELNREKCVALDEVQQMPEIFRQLRGIIDSDRRPGKLLLLGSASPELLRQSSESLAGRVAYLELTPFLFPEVKDQTDWKTHWLRGGFPLSLFAPDGAQSLKWRKNFIRSYLERDLPSLGLGADYAVIRRFWQMLAGENGGIWQASKFAKALGIAHATVSRYFSYFENAFLVRTLQPWFANVSKRLVKSPKVYHRDSGLLHAWLDLETLDSLLGNTAVGPSWEGYVIEQVYGWSMGQIDLFFYRTHQGAECDLVLVKGNKPVASIGIKFSMSPTPAKGFYIATEDLDTADNFIIYPGEEVYPVKKGYLVVGLNKFLEEYLPTYLT